MRRRITFLALVCLVFISCGKKENAGEPPKSADAPAAAPPSGGPHAFVHLKNGTKVPGSIVASSKTDLVLAGDDGIERKIPLTQVASVEYGDAQTPAPIRQAPREPAPAKRPVSEEPAPSQPQTAQQTPLPPPP